MAKPDAWMPLYVADYLADTTRLTTEQHGAYLLLLIDYWRNGRPPNDDRVLAQITGLTLTRWLNHRPVLERFFTVDNGVWSQKRADEEMQKAVELQANLSGRGKKGAEARWGNATANATSITQAEPSPMPADAPSPSPSPTSNSKTLSGRPDFKAEASEILNFLNAKTGKKYKPVAANIEMIVARLREGFSCEDIRAVVAKKCRDWKGDDKMDTYLRPKTLFSRTNFANYEGELLEVSHEQTI
jgi:uncharacterized phage protein (TIGR02220 family)